MPSPHLYPPFEAFNTDFLAVSDLHTIHFEQSGNKNGIPVLILHGGPGGGMRPEYRRCFNPKKWHIIQLSQRGCGQSTPFAELRENTTWDLVEDNEKLRRHLNIKQWAVFGGSWGSTLSLAYSQVHPQACLALFLRGIFLVRQREIQWFYQEGCSRLFPDSWESFIAPIPLEERHDFVTAYYKRLTDNDPTVRQEAAKAWSVWEASNLKLLPDPNLIQAFGEDQFAEAFARIECHYFINKCFFDEDNYLLNRVDKIRHLPCVIVHGRYDVVCPAESAWALHKAWPEAQLHIIADAGHAVSEPGIEQKLVEATDNFEL